MTYQETINYLYTRLPMFSRIGAAAYKKDLHNTIALCSFLDNPQQKIKSVHIAGTNGKGSVSHQLAAVFQAAGYKTGLYTSPHLRDFRERIRVDGAMVDTSYVVGFVERIMPIADEIEPSFFEITVAMAFDYFTRQDVDIAIIETGLGGRFDSTNIIIPELSVITNIGWDHVNILGDTLPAIAAEKAGIIKPGIPVVIGEALPETSQVFMDAAARANAPIIFAEEQRKAIDWKYQSSELVVEVVKLGTDEKNFYHLDLTGIYQTRNLVTTLEALHQLWLQGWNLHETQIKNGLKKVKKLTGLHGRWEVIRHHPEVVLDVAHNAEGMQQVLQQVELIDPAHLHIVLGMVKDKDINRVLALLPTHARYYFTQARIPRALDAGLLKQQANAFGLHGESYGEVNAAVKAAIAEAKKEDLVLVCGSVFVVGEVALE
ncbi:MAG TPA: folylpolyglutamate synthase/dihydrofolate synthase family protein [Chitinophagaceae bacterium]|nr:folylpolyglutamate synthase/dihydrofolate synthase family protein [Chitinophagaceae bacterium]